MICEAVNSKLYLFLWGMTREISLIWSSIGSLLSIMEAAVPLGLMPFEIVLIGRGASSILRFLEAGSEGAAFRSPET